MITLYIDRSEHSKEKLADYLREVANDLEKGIEEGEDWEITGQELKENSTLNIDDVASMDDFIN